MIVLTIPMSRSSVTVIVPNRLLPDALHPFGNRFVLLGRGDTSLPNFKMSLSA
jgi:hypothetical protein